MQKIFKPFSVAAASAVLLLAAASPIFASDVTAEISGNGADSYNKIELSSKCSTNVYQKNDSNVSVNVDVNQNTGGNEANKNTGGDVSITTGDATSSVNVTVGGNVNVANLGDCCCANSSQDQSITNNGADSTNKIESKVSNFKSVTQKNYSTTKVKVKKNQKTGKNQSNKNTDGSVSVDTGTLDSSVNVDVTGGANAINP